MRETLCGPMFVTVHFSNDPLVVALKQCEYKPPRGQSDWSFLIFSFCITHNALDFNNTKIQCLIPYSRMITLLPLWLSDIIVECVPLKLISLFMLGLHELYHQLLIYTLMKESIHLFTCDTCWLKCLLFSAHQFIYLNFPIYSRTKCSHLSVVYRKYLTL